MSVITGIGISVIVIYSIIKIMAFYGLNVNEFGIYIAFYVFLFLSIFVLPYYYPFTNNEL